MPTTVGFVINIEPHYHEATFDGIYRDITAKDILDVAPKVCVDFYRQQTSGLPLPRELARREGYRLHYIVDEVRRIAPIVRDYGPSRVHDGQLVGDRIQPTPDT